MLTDSDADGKVRLRRLVNTEFVRDKDGIVEWIVRTFEDGHEDVRRAKPNLPHMLRKTQREVEYAESAKIHMADMRGRLEGHDIP